MVNFINYNPNYNIIKYNFNRFKIKYHPDDSVKRKEEQTLALKVGVLYLILLGLFLNTIYFFLFL